MILYIVCSLQHHIVFSAVAGLGARGVQTNWERDTQEHEHNEQHL